MFFTHSLQLAQCCDFLPIILWAEQTSNIVKRCEHYVQFIYSYALIPKSDWRPHTSARASGIRRISAIRWGICVDAGRDPQILVILVTRFQFVYMYYPWSRLGAPAHHVVYGAEVFFDLKGALVQAAPFLISASPTAGT